MNIANVILWMWIAMYQSASTTDEIYFVFCGYKFASEIVLVSSITTFLALKRFMIHRYSHRQTDKLIMIWSSFALLS